ncbi:MAG: 2-dehydropantoate 2-reductase [Gemmatimonadota bacterium]
MRFLVVGAGAIGGYFGGRLLEVGCDVTFLVRPQRAVELARTGLIIKSRYGDASFTAPPTITPDDLRESFDLVLLSVKAYDLDDAMESFAAAVGPQTSILPLLNGMGHLDRLDARFGAQHVLGGLCMIAVTLDDDGTIRHLNENHSLTFGERDHQRSARVKAIFSALSDVRFDLQSSERILQEMWEKWIFIASVAGVTCLMRASIGDIVAAGGAEIGLELFDQCAAIATRHGFPPSEPSVTRSHRMLTTAGSSLTASMLRDIERGARTEADHIVGDLLRRNGERLDDARLLRIVFAHLMAYETRRTHE